MPIVILTMLVVLLLSAAIIAVVVIGMEGTGRERHREFADAMARTARHLNGEGEPPRALVALFDEIDEVSVPDVKDLPAKIRSLRSARSATSAESANQPDAEAWAPAPTPDAPAAGESATPVAQESTPAAPALAAVAAPDVPAADDLHDQMRAALAQDPHDDPAALDPYAVWGSEGPDESTVVRVDLPHSPPARR